MSSPDESDYEKDFIVSGWNERDGIFVPVVNPLYKMSTVAKLLDLSVPTLARYRREGLLKVLHTAVGVRIRHTDMVDFVQARYGKKD